METWRPRRRSAKHPLAVADLTASVPIYTWLWNAWLEKPSADAVPVHGFMTSTCAHIESSLDRYLLASGNTLHVANRILSCSEHTAFAHDLVQDPHKVSLRAFWPDAPIISVGHRRNVLMRAFDRNPVRVDARYGLISLDALWGPAEDGQEIIRRCEELSGLPLRSDFATHLGGFDVFQMPAWLDGPCPFELEFLHRNGTHIARLWIGPPRAHELVMHLEATYDQEEVFNRSSQIIPIGASRFEVLLPCDIDGFKYSLFDPATGQLIHSHSGAFIREAGGQLAIAGRTILHNDKLERSAQGTAAYQRASQSTSLHRLPLRTAWDPSGLRTHRKTVDRYIEACFDTHSSDRWFPSTLDDQLGALDYLNTLLNTMEFNEAILVDPFFGSDALERFATRLTRHSAKVTVVASWARTDPDTAEAIRGQPEEVNNLLMQRLEALLQQIGPHLAPQLQVINVLAGTKPAFHDRYLLIDRLEGLEQVFLLSNSLNNLAADWPFCLSELTGSARRLAAGYVRDLVSAKALPGQTSLTINFRWPPHASQRS